MAARFLPDASATFTNLLRRRLAQTIGAGVLVAGLGMSTGCTRSDLACFDFGAEGTCAELGEDSEGQVVCQDGSTWELVQAGPAGITQDADCCFQASIVDAGACASPPPGPGGFVVDGRPLVLEGEARTATLRPAPAGDGWIVDSPVDVSTLSPGARAWLGARWRRAARMEHASIASFAKFALDLTAHGAPPELLLAAHSAAADEVRHARACLSLAAACSGRAAVPSAIEFPGGRVDLQVDLAAFAADVVREGCIGETLAAIQAAEQLVGTKDVATARVLATIVEDESSHAELAWRTVRWALDQGGDRVRRAVAAAFADADAMAVPSGLDHVVDLTAWGFPRSARIQAALERAVADVIRPAAEALLNR